MTIYAITNWNETFENGETRRYDRLRWVPTPNKHDGLGFRRMAKQPDRCELFAGWNLLLQVCSKGAAGLRHLCVRDAAPLLSVDLSDMTGFPEAVFDRVFDFFSRPEIGWLIKLEWDESTPLKDLLNPLQPESVSGNCRSVATAMPQRCNSDAAALRIERKGKEQKGTGGEESKNNPPIEDKAQGKELKFEPVNRGLFPREYQTLLQAADAEIERLKASRLPPEDRDVHLVAWRKRRLEIKAAMNGLRKGGE